MLAASVFAADAGCKTDSAGDCQAGTGRALLQRTSMKTLETEPVSESPQEEPAQDVQNDEQSTKLGFGPVLAEEGQNASLTGCPKWVGWVLHRTLNQRHLPYTVTASTTTRFNKTYKGKVTGCQYGILGELKTTLTVKGVELSLSCREATCSRRQWWRCRDWNPIHLNVIVHAEKSDVKAHMEGEAGYVGDCYNHPKLPVFGDNDVQVTDLTITGNIKTRLWTNWWGKPHIDKPSLEWREPAVAISEMKGVKCPPVTQGLEEDGDFCQKAMEDVVMESLKKKAGDIISKDVAKHFKT